MEEDLLPLAPGFKLFKERSILTGTFIGGPLVAGYLIAENFRQLGEPVKARRTWMLAILATIIILGSIAMIPDTVNIPNYVIPVIYTGLTAALVKHFQGKQIEGHIAQGGQIYPAWRAVLAGIIGLVAFFALIAVLVLTGVLQ